MTPKSDFKGTPLFDIECLTNSTRYASWSWTSCPQMSQLPF